MFLLILDVNSKSSYNMVDISTVKVALFRSILTLPHLLLHTKVPLLVLIKYNSIKIRCSLYLFLYIFLWWKQWIEPKSLRPKDNTVGWIEFLLCIITVRTSTSTCLSDLLGVGQSPESNNKLTGDIPCLCKP